MSTTKPHVILNPTAGSGRAGKLRTEILSGIQARFGKDYTSDVTQQMGDATESARRAIEAGAGLVIAIGGDGTINETVNGFYKDGELLNPSCELGIIDCGSGSGLALSLNLPTELEQQLDLIKNEDSCAIDLGRVIARTQENESVERIFASECQVGIGGAVVAEVSSAHKRIGGKAAFGLFSLKQAFVYKAKLTTVRLGDGEEIAKPLLGLAIGNGDCTAGGMKLTPGAELNDGLLDVLLMHDMNIPTILWHFSKIYKGTHVDTPHVSIYRSNKFSIDSASPVPVSADGELLGVTPCEFELLPAVLKVRCSL
ncbi:MAG: diacylglycerol kinase family lipid kinase [Fidelibacterota bacterium]|nr:MAG: diacylglycerol kinase family lipid kinase [Candidatus Neomarinimicrobiota bacterium]